MLKNYLNSLVTIGNNIDEKIISKIVNALDKTTKNKKKIFICGNGGSSSLSEHALCDWTKRLYPNKKLKLFDLTSNKSLISAISNDLHFSEIFSYQLKIFAEKNDVCIFISSSGNSENIIKGIKTAKKNKVKSIAITGFKGGLAKKLADISLHLNTSTYEHHEDMVQIIMHYIYLKLKE